ncbi:MAG TPA: aminotransferase class V-fold PLP-dependent enzyme [Spirochaetota bacterium]|nr:aminotransferase class V-fold PLP-dependent enzyme [Spirochaetota bacterium]
MDYIYFDNAATSWPKPPETTAAMNRYNDIVGGNPGRSGHRLSVDAGRIVLDTRDLAAELFNVDDPFQIVFTKNATEALNLALLGLLRKGNHVVTTSMEHNSVMRPLRYLETQGIEVTTVPCSSQGDIDPQLIQKSLRPDTSLIVMTHASNVTGTIMPVREIGRIAGEHGVPFCVDAAQSAGALPIDVAEMNISLLAFTGHKSLFGPQGTGGLYIRKRLENTIRPLMMGGTGSKSEFEVQPDFLPDKYESGTPNTPGLAGLGAGIEFIMKEGIDNIRSRETRLTKRFLEGIRNIPSVKVYGPADADSRTSVVSFNIGERMPSEVSEKLDDGFGIMSRPGLHCAPSAHTTIGTFPTGTVRFSFGFFTTEQEIDYAVKAIDKIASVK